MRLTQQEHNAIAQAAAETFPAGTSVSLFGSRTDDTRKGGDIDLLIETQQPTSADLWVAQRNRFVARIWKRIGERQIDVVLANRNCPDNRPIIISARLSAIPLTEIGK